jgi:hypothetical protein
MDIPAELEQDWPNLTQTNYRITSPHTGNYNCLAWANQEADRWWSPLPEEDYYWPEGVPREVSMAAFVKAYETLGFKICEHGELEADVEKLAIYATPDGRPQHVARQLSNGLWTSKLGRLEDIEHELDGLSGELYGTVQKFMGRPRVV